MARPIPEGFNTVTPAITFKDVRRAIDFYKRALGAVEHFVMPGPDGKGVMHAEIQIGSSVLMMGEENVHCPSKSAQTLGASPVGFYLYVADADVAFKKAVDAGATVLQPVSDMFWGDRMGTLKDPFGHTWMVATHTRDLTPQEIAQGAEAAMAAMAQGGK